MVTRPPDSAIGILVTRTAMGGRLGIYDTRTQVRLEMNIPVGENGLM